MAEVTELGGGEYEAIVEGTDNYTVHLTMKNGMVEDQFCDCPYDMGPVCKHLVAVLFYLQEDQLDVVSIPIESKKAIKTEKQPKGRTVAEQVDDILRVLPEKEIKDLIRAMCKSDREFRTRFLARFANISSPPSKELYVAQIKNLHEVYSDQYGMIDYYKSREFSQAVSELLDSAENAIDGGEPRMAVSILFAALEELPSILNTSDDSSGYLGGCMEHVFQLLDKLIDAIEDEPFRKDVFTHLLATSQNRNLIGWGWNFDLLSHAIKLIATPEGKTQIAALINKVKPTGDGLDWEYRKAQSLMLQLIEETEDFDSVKKYLMANVSNPHFRERLIEQAIEAEDYKEALELANDGVAESENNRRVSGDQWKQFQLEIYQKIEDKENVICLAHYFIMEVYGKPEKRYFNLLKKNISTDSWGGYLEKMIADIFKGKNWYDYEKIEAIYIWEGYWDRYLVLLQNNTSLKRIEYAEKYLGALYPEQLLALYQLAILSFVEENVGRSYYKEACRYIRRMKKMGGGAMANELIERLRASYKNRRALLEELNKV